ncbi:MAG: hypothetical protein NXI31_05060 [bacterium]|nr:hypothetical protein [bacterium]
MPAERKSAITLPRVVFAVAIVVAMVAVVALVGVALAARVSTLDDFATHDSIERYSKSVSEKSKPRLIALRDLLDGVGTIVDELVFAERIAVAASLDAELDKITSQPRADALTEVGRRIATGLAVDELETALRELYAAGIRCYLAEAGSGTADDLLTEHRQLGLAIATWRRQAGSAATAGDLEPALLELTERLTLWLKNECRLVIGETIEAGPTWPRAAALQRLGEAAWTREEKRRGLR